MQDSDYQYPASRRVYKCGSRSDLNVPMREISLHVTRGLKGDIAVNDPIPIYDTSGPWGDPHKACDVRDGLEGMRRTWIIERGDVEEYEGRSLSPVDNGYRTNDEERLARERSPHPSR